MKNIWFLIFIVLSPALIFGQLSGTYTIGGTNPDYSTITQALNALSNGVSGPVIFNIRNGVYTEAIWLNGNFISGSSSTNTITFQSETQYPSVIIYAPTSWVLNINSAWWIKINNLILNGRCNISGSYFIEFTNNIYYPSPTYQTIYIGNPEHLELRNNIFYGNVWISDGNYDTISNNYFHGNLDMRHSDNATVVFNNFGSDPNNYFINQSDNSIIENNIMPAAFLDPYGNSTVRYNNYPFSGGYPYGGGLSDIHPFFIDPDYVNSSDLHATNPQLIGKGIYNAGITTDMDSLDRPDPPTLGANELCISSHFVNSYCGDSISLSLCNMPLGNNLLWTPSMGLSDIHAARPKVSINSSQWYYVTDTILGYSDSVYVNVNAYNVYAGSDDSILYCGYPTILSASFNASANYQWNPVDSLSLPSSNYTSANPTQTTTYSVIATVPGCPVSTDSVIVFVNSFPFAYIYLNSQNQNEICFLNASTCADTYFWDFGDSTNSTAINPCHIYPDTGYFLVTFIACNNFGCDTIQGLVYVDSILFTNNLDIIENDVFKFFPNPTKDKLNIVFTDSIKVAWLEFININGECVFNTSLENTSTINFDLAAGLYIVRIKTENKIINKKLIILE